MTVSSSPIKCKVCSPPNSNSKCWWCSLTGTTLVKEHKLILISCWFKNFPMNLVSTRMRCSPKWQDRLRLRGKRAFLDRLKVTSHKGMGLHLEPVEMKDKKRMWPEKISREESRKWTFSHLMSRPLKWRKLIGYNMFAGTLVSQTFLKSKITFSQAMKKTQLTLFFSRHLNS